MVMNKSCEHYFENYEYNFSELLLDQLCPETTVRVRSVIKNVEYSLKSLGRNSFQTLMKQTLYLQNTPMTRLSSTSREIKTVRAVHYANKQPPIYYDLKSSIY